MPCLTFKNATTGEVSYVQVVVGESYTHPPGAILVTVEPNCSKHLNEVIRANPLPKNTTRTLQQELNDAVGGGAGDWIKSMVAPFAKLIGKKSCTQCEARRLATNAYAKLKVKYGQIEALRIIKELWGMSFTDNPDKVLEKLQGYLDGDLT